MQSHFVNREAQLVANPTGQRRSLAFLGSRQCAHLLVARITYRSVTPRLDFIR